MIALFTLFFLFTFQVMGAQSDSDRLGAVAGILRPESLRSPVNEVFQWSATTKYKFSEDTNQIISATSYLWIPEHCQEIKGALLFFKNVCDESLTANPAIRSVCEAHGLAIVWVDSYIYLYAKDEKDDWKKKHGYPSGAAREYAEFVSSIFSSLAEKSGYTELSSIPWLPLAQSAQQPMLSFLLDGAPECCIAEIAVKDPRYSSAPNANRTVPLLNWKGTGSSWDQGSDFKTNGSFFAHWTDMSFYSPFLQARAKASSWPASFVVEGWSSHFGASEAMVQYFAEYIAAAVEARLPDRCGEPLKSINPSQGWVAGLPIPLKENGRTPFAPIRFDEATAAQKAEPWFFTKSLAQKAYDIAAINWSADTQCPALLDESGNFYPHKYRDLQQFHVQLDEDGTFQLRGRLMDKLPSSFKVDGNSPLRMTPGSPIISWLCGNAAPVGHDRWHIYLDRTSTAFSTDHGVNNPWFIIYQPGDNHVRGVEQPFQVLFDVNQQGAVQKIDFGSIPDVTAGVKAIHLSAKASSGLPVHYYVVAGPATIEKNDLIFDSIPPRSKFPIPVTVVAWQWGSSTDPKFQTAPSVAQTFQINSP